MYRRRENFFILVIFFLILFGLTIMNIVPRTKENLIKMKSPLQLKAVGAGDTMLPAGELENATIPGIPDMTELEHMMRNWIRDPFEFKLIKKALKDMDDQAPQQQEETASAEDAAEAKLTISLILIGEDGTTVTINKKPYKVGDMLQGEKIVKIQENSIILAKDNQTRELNLQKSPLTIITEETQ